MAADFIMRGVPEFQAAIKAMATRAALAFAGVLTEKERWTIIRATSARGPGHPL